MKSTYRFSTKFIFLTFLALGIGLFLSPGKVYAAQCPPGDEKGDYWGIANGPIDHGFASLTVRAVDQNGNPLNVNYELRSSLPGGHGGYDPPPQAGPNYNPHARIFQVDGTLDTQSRTDQRWFGTGGATGDSDIASWIYADPNKGRCSGWDQLGPGNSAQRGNRFVLDCQEQANDGTLQDTRFRISDITTPSGAIGQNGGYWTMQFSRDGNNLGNLAMNEAFSVWNGINARINMTWHPNPPEPVDDTGDCNLIRFTIPNDNQDGQGGNSNFSDYAIYVNDGGTPGHPAAAGSADYQDGGVYGSPPGPWVDYSGSVTEPQFVGIPGATVEKNLRLDNKVVSGTLRYTVVIYDKFTNTNGNNVIKVRSRFTRAVDNCYQATCSVNIPSNVPGKEGSNGALRAGEKFGGTITITNNGINNIPSALVTNSGNFQLAATISSGFAGLPPYVPMPTNIPPGQSRNISLADFDFRAPNNVGSHNLTVYPDFWGRGPIGPSCNAAIRTFRQFNLNVSADVQMSPDSEDPATVSFLGLAQGDNGFNVHYNALSRHNGATVDSVSNGYGPIQTPYNFPYNPPSNAAGDEYCLNFTVVEAYGWIGPNNEFGDTGSASASSCQHVFNRPYLRAYGADVMAGNVCGGSGNDIRAYISGRNGKTGSGGQLGVFSLGSIDGFISASLRYTLAQPRPNKGLTFANTGPSSFGGDFGAGVCPSDYFAGRDNTAPNLPSSGSLATVRNSAGKFNANGPITFVNGGSQTRQKAIYVQGDVYINGNITYANTGSYGSVETIPRFTLIASGNIYISRSVSQLDGTYVAGGKISTCANAAGSYSTAQLWNLCRGNRLTINGAFIAPVVDFLRSRGSLRDSRTNDDNATRNNAGEIFIYSPELYLAQLLGESTGSSGGSQIYQPKSYDAITTLPPIL